MRKNWLKLHKITLKLEEIGLFLEEIGKELDVFEDFLKWTCAFDAKFCTKGVRCKKTLNFNI